MKAEWQPIETAPRDGSAIWLVEADLSMRQGVHQFAGHWQRDERYEVGGYWRELARGYVSAPTHWMPLPDPPESQG